MSYVQQQRHINESAELLSFFSGKDADTYKYLPIEEISDFAEDVVMKMNEPDEQKKTLDEALEKASSIKKNQELLDEAIDLANKDKLTFTRQTSKKTEKAAASDDSTDQGSERPETKPVDGVPEAPAAEGESRTSNEDIDIMVD